MPAERDRTIDALTAAFAAGELTMEEFEKRVETANRTNDEIALRRLLADLPRFSGDMPAAAHTTTYTAGTTWSRDWKDYSGRMSYRGGKADPTDGVQVFAVIALHYLARRLNLPPLP
jgi:hypothetical protein